jgi:hypothetical protein
LVESTQIRWFSRRSGGGGWSYTAIAQRRSRVSKQVLKGLSDCHFNETAVKAAKQGASGPSKKGYSHKIFTQKRRAGKQPTRESSTDKKKELLYLTPVYIADGRS